jgi:hypothetical protein
MPAQKPERPDPGHAMLLPRVGADPAGNTVQRAFDAISTAQQQVQRSIAGSPGRLLTPPLLLTGTGSTAIPDGTCMIRIRGIGQGGGGGGATSGVGTAGGGAGGSTGEVLEAIIGAPGGTPLAGTYSWLGGSSGGAGGSAAGGNGGTGADSTFQAVGVVYTAKGGGGGTGSTGAGTGNWAPTATATGTPAVGTSGVLRRTWGVGDDGQVSGGAAAWFSGDGGASEFGPGGVTVGGTTAGNPGGAFGGGGGGAAAAGGGSAIGGPGAVGAWIAEFYS